MRRLSWFSICSPALRGGSLALTLAVGCASAQSARGTSAASAANPDGASDAQRMSSLVRKQEEQQQRIAELESRLALLETEARSQRSAASAGVRSETIRIGAARHAEREPVASSEQAQEDVADVPVAPARRERVPTLRLYGAPPSAAGGASPDFEGGVPALSVAPLPEDRARALADASAGAADPKEEYRSALRLLREQRYDDALAGFDRFITHNPDHALVGNALYWRGEAHYAKRDYQLARESFETLLARFAASDKAPDSLLKVGLCLRRMGDEAQAKSYFRRVQEKFPKSDAAQIASREGST